MARIAWANQPADKEYQIGVDRGVYYPCTDAGVYLTGIPWIGLTACNENPEGGDITDLFADNAKYLSLLAVEEMGFTIEAYSYPSDFEAAIGCKSIKKSGRTVMKIYQQKHQAFGLCYRTEKGSGASEASKLGDHYKLHFCYGCKVGATDKAYETIDDSPDALTFSWEATTDKANVTVGGKDKKVSYIVIDIDDLSSDEKTLLEDKIYGVDNGANATLPTPQELVNFLATGTFGS